MSSSFNLVAVLAAVIGICVPILGGLNAWLLAKIRVEISGLKLEMLMSRMEEKEELRKWIETDFVRRSELVTYQVATGTRFERLENSRRPAELKLAPEPA